MFVAVASHTAAQAIAPLRDAEVAVCTSLTGESSVALGTATVLHHRGATKTCSSNMTLYLTQEPYTHKCL
ncbi:hypothetical protein DPMN_129148 [Dreissena polymorpha]|uniref:Uncharacterized protein n=1 Tax=Dreissena polymorpha TaxID=45954 RepID=A0A9D4H4D3_DREPO|nr:hypothetical protein DPMN_129148 [Dreissena polymorpha]